ncbi:Heavy-metal-associated domain-containing protein [Mucilaginibacter gossypiicola]|uniref:Heavy-metal-associated domain-containing protein n=1 Tax=Mucilaginibacter gossypiicola TaxID=551995 RepID=A0A1H8DLH6_9SPHI|nr:cation transporter [Mucilaginibacter gossypiicola]SEN08162.1 Heavy-metal-associated domain-containing protein [Mucilaginibacter gossypiicola]
MQTLKFKTTIKCGGCIATVTPVLDTLKSVEKWEVDTADPDKILTVTAAPELSAGEVISALQTKGYQAESV